MKSKQSFSKEELRLFQEKKSLQIRAGRGSHRFIGIWHVVVDERVVVRSWSIKPDGWYSKLLRDPRGTIKVGKTSIPIRSVPVKNKSFRDKVDSAYLEKYSTAGAIRYAKDLCEPKSKAATTELIPFKRRALD